MKVKIESLNPNPYRRIDNYPINREKVEALKESIDKTGFWDNLIARKKNDHFEIAYGHHRLIALRELGYTEIDIPVRDLPDYKMLLIMADENMDIWGARPDIVNETVLATKEFLDNELAKYESWEEACINKLINTLFGNAGNFGRCKKEGVGQTTILKFLGPPWKQWMIQGALATLTDEKKNLIDRIAVEKMGNINSANTFRVAVQKYNIPKKDQSKLADKIVKDGTNHKALEFKVAEYAQLNQSTKTRASEPKPKPKLDRELLDIGIEIEKLLTRIKRVGSYLETSVDSISKQKFFKEINNLHKYIIEDILSKEKIDEKKEINVV